MKAKLLAILKDRNLVQKSRHYEGFPLELSNREETRKLLGPAAFIAIQENSDGIFLYRFDRNGNVVGDTWHMTIEDAKHQADYEYGEAIEKWVAVPSETTDVIAFGHSCLKLNEKA